MEAFMHLALLTVLLAVNHPTRQLGGADDQPATSNIRGVEYPRVHADHRITFRFVAPKANKVQVAGGDGLGKGPFDMTRDDKGVWTVTIPPAVPGFHYYWLIVD